MIRLFSTIALLLSITTFAAEPTPVNKELKNLPRWTDLDKYLSKAEHTPFRNKEYLLYTGAHLGFKNGLGTDLNFCVNIRDFLCLGVNTFIGSLNSSHLVRPPIGSETTPNTTEYEDVLKNPESWFSFVSQFGITVNSPIISILDQRWSESAWFGFGKAFIGGRSGWAISVEPGINRTFSYNGNWGWSIKARYTYGWLNPKTDAFGSIPFDWYNLSTGLYYVW